MYQEREIIDSERLNLLNNLPPKKGKFVMYWMQSSQRTCFNHALTFAIEKANKLSQPLLVLFVIRDDFPESSYRHYAFMLEGLRDVWENFARRGIRFIIKVEEPMHAVLSCSKDASVVVTDMGYLGTDRQLAKVIAEKLQCQLVQVESDIVVPVKVASYKDEYTAFTLRRKLTKHLSKFLEPLSEEEVKIKSHLLNFTSFDVRDTKKALNNLNIKKSVLPSAFYRGGENEAHQKLKDFVEKKLSNYAKTRNNSLADTTSDLSPYLAFGQISPVEIALRVLETGLEGSDQFLEELIVRRELAINFVYYNKRYRSFDSVPSWAQKTLIKHLNDPKTYVYSVEDFENANTHDALWNAAQMQLLKTGKIPGYLRMYWGKKILEWAEDPAKAYKTAIYLNNKYALDGNSPNSFEGIAWCFGKHDRPFKERPIFGIVRCMSKSGLEKHFDTLEYINSINLL
jgi:deoxyribodipyrimidine photo-lyase